MGAEIAKVIAFDDTVLKEERVWSLIPSLVQSHSQDKKSNTTFQHFLSVVSFNVPTGGSSDWRDGWAYRRGDDIKRLHNNVGGVVQ